MSKQVKNDPRYLDRGKLERELVLRDKQALIGDCLKIFDTNTVMFEQMEILKAEAIDAAAAIRGFKVEIDRLNARSLWQVLNERIARRIEKIRKRKASFNYPVK